MNQFLCIMGVLVFAVCVQCGPPEEFKNMMDECAAENGLTDKPTGPPDFNDSKVKCAHACLMKKMGKMVDGKVSLEKELETMTKHMPGASDTIKAKLTECTNTANQQSDECEVAGAMAKCLFEALGAPPAAY